MTEDHDQHREHEMSHEQTHPTSTPPLVPETPTPRRRWAVPAVVGAVAVAAFAGPPLVAAAGGSDLPDVSAEELVAHVLGAEPTPLQGTLVHTARLGLLDLPVGELDGADPLALLGGSSTIRVWTDGTERSRLALLGSTSEYSVVRDGPEAWTYSSSDDRVVHVTLDEEGLARYAELAEDAADGTLAPPVAGDLPTPQEGAEHLLGELREHSNVSVDAPTRVAGRDAYQLVVTPADEGSLVARAVLAIDAQTWVPLRYQVWSVQDASAPAVEVGFTDVRFTTPDDAVLTFTPPAGAEVKEVVVPAEVLEDEARAAHEAGRAVGLGLPGDATASAAPDDAGAPERADAPRVTVHGEGWTRVVEVTGVDVEGFLADPSDADGTSFGRFGSERGQELFEELGPDGEPFDLDTTALYEQLTSQVPGGRLLSSRLLSALATDDGRLLVGAVPPQTLQEHA